MYTIGVTLSDIFGETTFTQTAVIISNPAPGFAAPGLILSSSSIAEGGAVTVSGQILSPGRFTRTRSRLIGATPRCRRRSSSPQAIDDFLTSHAYPNNPTGIDSATILSSVRDQSEWPVRLASATVLVNNVAPAVYPSVPSLSETNANEGDRSP